MDKVLNKILDYQVANNVTDGEVCESIGISRKTLYNVRNGEGYNEHTRLQVEDFANKIK